MGRALRASPADRDRDALRICDRSARRRSHRGPHAVRDLSRNGRGRARRAHPQDVERVRRTLGGEERPDWRASRLPLRARGTQRRRVDARGVRRTRAAHRGRRAASRPRRDEHPSRDRRARWCARGGRAAAGCEQLRLAALTSGGDLSHERGCRAAGEARPHRRRARRSGRRAAGHGEGAGQRGRAVRGQQPRDQERRAPARDRGALGPSGLVVLGRLGIRRRYVRQESCCFPMSPRIRSILAAVVILLTLPVYARVAPLDAPESRGVVPGTVVLDAHGALLEHDAADGLRVPVTLDAIAPRMLQATVSAEDRRFWQHPGVDPFAMARALAQLATQPSGASTITQQLARRLYLSDDTSSLPLRKAHEALIALQLEARRSKTDILDLYLNDVYYGRGAYGVEAAARVYFGISAANLDLAHASYLAGLPQRPASYDSPDGTGARARQSYVLARMLEDGWISAAEGAAALAVQIDVLPAQPPPAAHAFVSYALGELARVRPDLAGRAGLTVETTLDAGLQSEVERMVRLRLVELGDRNVTDAAVV